MLIQYINQYPEDKVFTYAERLRLLRERKLAQTAEKVEKEGGLDEDDYGRVVAPEYFKFKIVPNNPDGHFYGYSGWTENYTKLLAEHPLYVDPLDAFVGRGFFFLIRLRGMSGDPSYPYPWNPAYPFDELKALFDRYNIICGIGRDHQDYTPSANVLTEADAMFRQVEFTVALSAKGAAAEVSARRPFALRGDGETLPRKAFARRIDRRGNQIRYELAIPWRTIGLEAAPEALRMTLAVNDRDKRAGGISAMCFHDGARENKDPNGMGTLVFLKK